MLAIEHLTVRFGATAVVDDVSLTIGAGEKFALVGESGSGKSITALSVLGLVDGATTSGRIVFDGQDLRAHSEPQMRAIRGGEIAMIFQEPMTALNPLHTVGAQIVEVLRLHDGLGLAARRAIAPSPCSIAPASRSRRAVSTPTRTSSRAASASAR